MFVLRLLFVARNQLTTTLSINIYIDVWTIIIIRFILLYKWLSTRPILQTICGNPSFELIFLTGLFKSNILIIWPMLLFVVELE